MTSSFPAGLDALATNLTDATTMATTHKQHHDDLADAVNKIEAELGTLPKGAAADVKTRITNTETVANAAVAKSLVDAKGDLYVGTANDTVARLAVGSNNQVLTADSAQTGGIKWAAAGAVNDGVTVYNVKRDYSAVGDGATDDTTAIQNALNAASAAGGGIVFFPPGTYFLATVLTLKSNVTLMGAGMGVSFLKFSDTSSSTMMSVSGSLASSTTATADVAVGDRVIGFTSVAGYSVGDWVLLQDGTHFRGWVTRIGGISGTSVTMEEKSTHIFPSANTTIQRYSTMLTRIRVCDLTIQNTTGNCLDNTTRRNGAISVSNAVDTVIERVEFKGISADTSGLGLGIIQSRNTSVRQCKFDKCGDGDPLPVQNTRCFEVRYSSVTNCTDNIFQRSGGSAAISFVGCGHSVCSNNNVGGMTNWANTVSTGETPLTTDNGGRGIKFEEGNNFFSICGNVVHDLGFDGIRTHNSSYGTVAHNTILASHDIPLAVRDTGNGALDVSVIGNHIVRTSAVTLAEHGIYIQALARGTIHGNIVDNINTVGIKLDGATDCTCTGNVINSTSNYGIEVRTSGTRNIITGNIVRGSTANSINTTAGAGGNAVFANIVDRAVSLHASDKKINDSAAADSNWVL